MQETRPSRSAHHYYIDGDVVLRAEDTIYRVYRFALQHECELFKELFDIPQPERTEGEHDDTPIMIPRVSAEEMGVLFDVLWANYQDADSWGVDKIGSLLRISSFFRCPIGLTFGLHKLVKHPQSNNIEKLHIALQNQTPIARCGPLIRSLLNQSMSIIPGKHFALLGEKFMGHLLMCRESIQRVRFSAAIPSDFAPDPDCSHVAVCNTVWTAMWKKHMSRILFENEPLSSYQDILERANRLRECDCLIFSLANQMTLNAENPVITRSIALLKNCLVKKGQHCECEELLDEEVEDMDQY